VGRCWLGWGWGWGGSLVWSTRESGLCTQQVCVRLVAVRGRGAGFWLVAEGEGCGDSLREKSFLGAVMSHLQKGMAMLKEATLADQAGKTEDAIRQYMQGLELLQLATKRAPHSLSLCAWS
jgi:hypothetical protein